jgi:hypothetical protein
MRMSVQLLTLEVDDLTEVSSLEDRSLLLRMSGEGCSSRCDRSADKMRSSLPETGNRDATVDECRRTPSAGGQAWSMPTTSSGRRRSVFDT